MASEPPPPSSGDVKPPAQASELSKAPTSEGQALAEPLEEVSPKSVFVNSAPIREDQVQNAVKFLSHPRVKGSPVVHRRNFLERKGLTTEEIDEAFRRVPDSSPGAQTTTSSQEGQMAPLPNTQQQSSAQVIQPAGAAPSVATSILPRRFGWSHAFLAIGFLVASGAGTVIIFKKSIVPRLRSWIRGVVSDEDQEDLKRNTPSLNEEATTAAKAAAAAAADAAKASQELVIMKSEEKKHLEQFMSLMDAQLQEIKSMKTTLWKLEGQNYKSGRSHHIEEDYLNGTIARSRTPTDNGRADFDSRSARSSSPPVTSEPPHPNSYMEIMAMIQRGERPPNIRDINDAPPDPNQPISNPVLTPRPKPWETTKPASPTVQDLGVAYQFNSEPSPPTWQQKSIRIAEIENEDGHLRAGSNGEANIEQPPQRKWVPPQPPPVVMPEAGTAIRRPKATVSKDRFLDSTSSNGSEMDELQKVTKISESGGETDMNVGAIETGSSAEIQEEQVMV